MTSQSQTRVPAGVPTGGQFAASAHAEADVNLTSTAVVSAEDFNGRFRPEIDALDKRWRDEADVDGTFNGLIASLGQRVLNEADKDRPGYEKLEEALDAFRDTGLKDDDVAEEVLFCLQDITAPDVMKVAEDGNGGHVRLADGKAARTCPDCGNGYATDGVLALHREQDCTGLDVTRDYSLDRDYDGHDDADYDALHSAAESFASAINNAGVAEQVAFLRRTGHKDDEIAAVFEEYGPGEEHHALDDLVIDAASQFASQAYNDGKSDGAEVTRALEGQRWMLTADQAPVAKHPVALEPDESTHVSIRVPNEDGTSEEIVYRVTYREWVPDGDNGTPAADYRRGEFGVESEWAQHEYVVARESSPFRPAEGEKGQMVGHAWEQFHRDLVTAAKTSARARRLDPLRPYIEAAQATQATSDS